jgi:hypothetical protein
MHVNRIVILGVDVRGAGLPSIHGRFLENRYRGI